MAPQDVAVLYEDAIRELVTLDADGLDAVREAFRRLSAGDAVQPPVMRIDVPEHRGEVDVKGAYVRGLDSFAVKLSSGFFDNPQRGLPTASGLMVLIDAGTGVPRCVLLDNGYLTDVRTALAGAVAADALARPEVDTVAVLGAGAQARWQLRAMMLVRWPRRALVWARRPAEARRCAEDMGAVLGIEVEAVTDAEEAVTRADVVVTTTPATEPILRAEWLHPGLHVTAMGSDAEHKQELEPGVLRRADVLVSDRREQGLVIGELRAARAAGVDVGEARVAELGEVLAGTRPGRTSSDQITVCDLTGTGVQDTAIARLAAARAAATG
ncbi:MAG TPA: cyclodeaminase [Trueperaceae bacterium]|nr:cyclodeaminase [Trueperaceae bacterium]